jgi:hypothetical protein
MGRNICRAGTVENLPAMIRKARRENVSGLFVGREWLKAFPP